MRNMQFEVAVWNLFTSFDFIEGAARECEETMEWFGRLALSRQAANFGRNNQIYEVFKQRAQDFRRGAEMARHGDYTLVWKTAGYIGGDVRGMLEQSLYSWLTERDYNEFFGTRIGRIFDYTDQITRAFHNGIVGAAHYYKPNPNCPARSNDDDGFPGDKIVSTYRNSVKWLGKSLHWDLPDPLPDCKIDMSVSCKTGEEVPWTGVWYPSTGLEMHSLTFAIRGLRMQPVYRVTKTIEELQREDPGAFVTVPETVAVETTWHPVIQSDLSIVSKEDLWAKAGAPCPKAGRWQPTDPGAAQRHYEPGEMMADLESAYGLTVWRWIADR